jgi:2-polyprenyl-3-methyl-5-hydroxy-6-metoxy-1,4-benzoquinol methylase
MNTSAVHYATHLGPVYAWMLGDIDAAFARSAAEVDALPLPAVRGVAVDLGAGLGLHADALAKRGFEVVAIDDCPMLIDELHSRGGSSAITIHRADLQEFRRFLPKQAQVIVCMGDTLTHLPAVSAVESLLAAVASSLAPGGVFATTFRDYATLELTGEQRFILVRADAERIMTCFLEFKDHQVIVHDLLNEKEDGRWRQAISSYPKLRLAPEWVASTLSGLGFSVKRDTAPSGMVRIVAAKN